MRTCHRLLAKYREENRPVRTTPPPAYFDRYPELDRELEDVPGRLGEHQARLLDERDEVIAVANRALGRLRELVERELEELFAYVDGIEQAADRRLAEDARALHQLGQAA